jgi:hypothetical protein
MRASALLMETLRADAADAVSEDEGNNIPMYVGLPLRVQKPSGKVEKEEKASRSRENGVSWAEGAV